MKYILALVVCVIGCGNSKIISSPSTADASIIDDSSTVDTSPPVDVASDIDIPLDTAEDMATLTDACPITYETDADNPCDGPNPCWQWQTGNGSWVPKGTHCPVCLCMTRNQDALGNSIPCRCNGFCHNGFCIQ